MRSTLFPTLLLTSAALLPAQTWIESGDAGQVLGAGQTPAGSGPLTMITGVLASDADLYLIQIDNPAQFSASTVGGGTLDSQLFLFDAHGRGIVHNDDSVNYASTITGSRVPAPGRYWLAISQWDIDPVAAGQEIWTTSLTSGEHSPAGVRAHEVFDGWNGSVVTVAGYNIFLTGASFPQKRVVLPDNHHLSESPDQAGPVGTVNYWRSGGGRFQVLYEGSNFTSAGANAPVTITRLAFRAEDGEPGLAGVAWPNATVRVAATSLDAATMSTTFATNLAAPTTTVGPVVTGTVGMFASQGSTPNNDNIVIDLAGLGLSFQFDPAGPRPNLLLDVQLPTPAVLPAGTASVIAMQDASGDPVTFVRGRGLNSSNVAAATGTLEQPLVMAVEFTGTGGNRLVVPARNEQFGAGCGGSPSSFYQSFVNGQAFDLVGVRLVPDNAALPTYYNVTAIDTPVDLSKLGATPDSTADDAVVSHPLGFQFRAPQLVTNGIAACTNGFVWLQSATTDTDFTPSVGEFLGSPAPRLAPFWTDLHCGRNTTSNPNSGLHVVTDFSGGPGYAVCYATWRDIAVYNSVGTPGTSVITFQVVLEEATGVIEFRYGAMPRHAASASTSTATHPVLVGFTRGQIGAVWSVDPKSRDLSLEVPFRTFAEGATGNMGLAATAQVPGGATYGARMFAGQAMKWNVTDVPAGSLVGVQLIDVECSRPGFALPTITAPGCMLSTSANAVLWEVDVLPGPSVTGTVAFGIPPGFDGVEIYAQYVVLGGLFGAPDLITVSSNAIRHTVGRR